MSQVPYGWTKTQQAGHTDFRDSTGQLLLRLGWADQNRFSHASPDAYLRQLAAQTAKNYQGYKLIRFGGMTSARAKRYHRPGVLLRADALLRRHVRGLPARPQRRGLRRLDHGQGWSYARTASSLMKPSASDAVCATTA